MSIWIIAFIALIISLIFTGRRKFSKTWVKVVLIISEIFLALYFLFRIFFPMLPMPDPTGPNTVQVDMIYYSHRTRYPDMATDGSEREIPVHVYHPEHMEKAAHPLFVFSHGSFGVGSSNETLFYELASRGYIVMSLDHPHHAFFATMSSGKRVRIDRKFFHEVVDSKGTEDLAGTLESLNRWLDPRIEDINFVLDKVFDDTKDNPYEDKIDTGRVILSGHSLGGAAALAVGRARPEDIQALVVLEAPFAKDIVAIDHDRYRFVQEEYPRTILHIYSDALWDKLDTITTYALNEQLIRLRNPKFRNAHIKGVGHIGLTDFSLTSPILTDMIDGGINKKKAPEALLELNHIVLDFLATFEE